MSWAPGGGFLNSLAHGGGFLVLEGEAGIGKTTVWRELIAGADGRGYRVLSCQPAASEVTLSFAGLADLLSDLDASVLECLPLPQRHALEVALLQAAPGSRPLEQRAVFAGFGAVLVALAGERPLLVAIDDLQWLDRPTQAALEFAMRRVRGHPIGFLCASRTEVTSSVTSGLDRVLTESGAERAQLGPLSVGALHQLILARLGRALTPARQSCGLPRRRGETCSTVSDAERRGDDPTPRRPSRFSAADENLRRACARLNPGAPRASPASSSRDPVRRPPLRSPLTGPCRRWSRPRRPGWSRSAGRASCFRIRRLGRCRYCSATADQLGTQAPRSLARLVREPEVSARATLALGASEPERSAGAGASSCR